VATPASKAEQVSAVTRRFRKAKGTFTLTGVQNGQTIALFVDAWSEAGGNGDQVFGLGRNIDTVRC
jgi:hypothetical protein